jgi:hypothetical protein
VERNGTPSRNVEDMKPEDTQSNISESLIIFVDIIFGVVIAESFAQYHDSLFHPSLPPSPIFAGLLTVYIVTVMSWIGYHSSVTKYPYKNSNLAKLRFSIDLVIVAMYAYLFYSVGTFETNPDLSSYLLGFPIIFTLYIASGLIKQKEYNDEASKQRLLRACLVVFILMYCIYHFLVLPLWFSYLWPLNWVFILLPLIVNAEYRRRRGW